MLLNKDQRFEVCLRNLVHSTLLFAIVYHHCWRAAHQLLCFEIMHFHRCR